MLYEVITGLGAGRTAARTISIEVGMQNSGLAVALAGAFFGPAAALPGAIFSLWQNLAGVTLARVWARDAEAHDAKPGRDDSCPTA